MRQRAKEVNNRWFVAGRKKLRKKNMWLAAWKEGRKENLDREIKKRSKEQNETNIGKKKQWKQ